MVYTYTPFSLFTRTGYIITQHNTDYSVNGLNSDVERYLSVSFVSASNLPAVAESPTSVNSDSVNYNSMT